MVLTDIPQTGSISVSTKLLSLEWSCFPPQQEEDFLASSWIDATSGLGPQHELSFCFVGLGLQQEDVLANSIACSDSLSQHEPTFCWDCLAQQDYVNFRSWSDFK